jgi:hypothetical protein
MAARRIGTSPPIPPPIALINPNGVQLPVQGAQALIIYPNSNTPVLNHGSFDGYKAGVSDLLGDYTYGDLDSLVSEFEQEMQGTMIEMDPENDEICKEILESRCEDDEENESERESSETLTTLDPGYINKYLTHIEDSGNSQSTDMKVDTPIPMDFCKELVKTDDSSVVIKQESFLENYAADNETVTSNNTQIKGVETIECEPCTVTVTTSTDPREPLVQLHSPSPSSV